MIDEPELSLHPKWQQKIVKIKTGDEFGNSYGQTTGRILEDIMGLETDRNPSVNNLLNLVKEMVKNDNYENSKFEEKYAKIKDILGEDDRDLFLVDMDLQIKKGRKNAESR